VVHSSIFWISKWMWPLYTQHAATLSVFPKKKGISCVFIGKKNWPFLESKQWIDMLLFAYPTTSHYMVGYCRLYDVIWHSVSMKNLQYIPTLINQPSFISSIRCIYIYSIIYRSPKKDRKVMYLHFNGIWLFYLVADYYTQYTVFSRSPCFFPPTRKLA
jgi:hypothetical protein